MEFKQTNNTWRENMKNTKLQIATALVALSGLAAAVPTYAGLVFSIENAGVQASTVPGVVTEDFNSAPVGAFSGSVLGGLGSLTSGGAIVAPDAYGGSAPPPITGSDYYAVGVQSGQTAATLTLSTAQHYFGLEWLAGDAANVLTFYNGATVIGTYHVGDIIPSLGPAYFGNPNNGADSSEPFVYLDFTTTGSDAITSVQFNNNLQSGFEMDNMSVLAQEITPPGNPVVPEPSTCISGALLLLPFGASTLRILRKNRVA
jgi:hypothetical protein